MQTRSFDQSGNSAHDAAAYARLLRAKVQTAQDDPRPSINAQDWVQQIRTQRIAAMQQRAAVKAGSSNGNTHESPHPLRLAQRVPEMQISPHTMNSSKESAPHGWYVASYLLRFVELTDPEKDNLEKRFITWENTILVQATDLNSAYDKAVGIAGDATAPYKGGREGVAVQWVFEGITELLPIYEEIADGAEIMWADHAPRMLKNIRRSVVKREGIYR